jgi:magnesium transporter
MNTTLLVCNQFMRTHPVAAARLLEQMPSGQVSEFMAAAESGSAARTAEHMNMELAADCIERMNPEAAIPLLAELHPDAQVSLLRLMPAKSRRPLIEGLPKELAGLLKRMLKYPKGTVGELMDPFVFTVPEDISVQETLKRARAAKLEMPFYVYVLDRKQMLAGVVSLKNLIRSKRNNPVSSEMRRELVSLKAASAQAEMLKSPYWREFHILPVIDDDGLFQGVVRYQTITRLREELSSEPERDDLLETVLALGELYWMGLSGVVDGFAGRRHRDPVDRTRASKE